MKRPDWLTWGNVFWACAVAAVWWSSYQEMDRHRQRADVLWDLSVRAANKIDLLELRIKSLEQDRASR